MQIILRNCRREACEMQKISVKLKNCYGINELEHEFEFANKRANLIYAPNGMMKTSLANTFKDHSNGVNSEDRIYSDRISERFIQDENGNDISKESVLVIEPYDSKYESSRVSSLLVNESLKKEYDNILLRIDGLLDDLMSSVRKSIGIRSGLEDVISVSVTRKKDNILKALERIKGEVLDEELDSSLSNVDYSVIYNEKVEKLLNEKSIKDALKDYTRTYDDLLNKSRFFRKGIFNHYQANEIAKQLKNHGFFKADHKVFLKSESGETEVKTEEDLEKLIGEELSAILSSNELKSAFDKIDKKISNQELRTFREFLLSNETIIPRLEDPELLKAELLKYHIMLNREKFSELINEYGAGKKRLEEIAEAASEQATKWQDVINIFNQRFSVPFKVIMQNKQDVILRRVTPNVGFIFDDQNSTPTPVEREKLIGVLSNGERRALYILNVIFEIQARTEDQVATLMVIDDIADSFDYKNKYAIIEYLSDILSIDHFRQIILTHNYDFYRTVWNRLQLAGVNFHVARTSERIVLTRETMYKDPFERWKKCAADDERRDCLFAMIPFVRNLADYCGFESESSQLTTALHIKLGQPKLTVGDMLQIFSKILNGQEFETQGNPTDCVIQNIFSVAEHIVEGEDPALDLEKKVVLSIAIRLKAENYMIRKIHDDAWVASITKNQTAKLAKKFKEIASEDATLKEAVRAIDRVTLMTPENIHLNSFMYEPILDMSSEHLQNLYSDVSNLLEHP